MGPPNYMGPPKEKDKVLIFTMIMIGIRKMSTILLIAVILPTMVAPFIVIRKLSSSPSSYYDNPSISPLKLMNSNAAFPRLTSKDMPDLPESFSTSAKRLSFSGIPYKAMIERLQYF
ncbi:hypothetical protein Y032_0109g94 [Ancylostoma ceylanicum]|nr:hypothetical protein Y032_0109g94 [Ancylostoma ceylanicum]